MVPGFQINSILLRPNKKAELGSAFLTTEINTISVFDYHSGQYIRSFSQ